VYKILISYYFNKEINVTALCGFGKIVLSIMHSVEVKKQYLVKISNRFAV
jgi:hypothetical protein